MDISSKLKLQIKIQEWLDKNDTDFSCPYCSFDYDDINEVYHRRIKRSKTWSTKITCQECKKKFNLTIDTTGDYQSFI